MLGSCFVQGQNENGVNSWVGHVYDGTNRNISYNETFTNYLGSYTEDPVFEQNFFTNNGSFYLGYREVRAETFSVRYRMNSSAKGLFTIAIGSDDGSRLAIDDKLIYNHWSDHSYTVDSNILLSLTGTSNLVLDYYENSGDNRISFGNAVRIIENVLTQNTSQTLFLENMGQPISGDVFGALPNGISPTGSGYQWYFSKTERGTKYPISGATGATYTPSTAKAPFDSPGTYYIFRQAKLTSSNNRLANNYQAVNYSNPSILEIKNVSSPTASSNSPICVGGTLQLNASTVSGATYQWTGPNQFTSNLQNPFIENVTANQSGIYSVRAVINGNESEPASTSVKIDESIYNNGIGPTVCGRVGENGTLNITAPEGNIFTSVIFASYGTPTGTCGSFEKSTCHSTSSQSIVEKLLIGNNTATITANNSTFGDPCVGTVKELVVQATYKETVQTICSGETPELIPGTLPSGSNSFSYLWESSTSGSSTGFSAAMGDNKSKDYAPGPLKQTTWFRRKVISGNCAANISNAIKIEVTTPVPNPTASNNGPLCIGATLNLAAVNIEGATYNWTGPNNFTSSERNPSILNVNERHAGKYSVTATVNECTSEVATTVVDVNSYTIPTTDENAYGTNSWIGHVYDDREFGTYVGTYSEREEFSQNFGGIINCFQVSHGTGANSIYTQQFSVRYLNQSSKNGLYVANLGSDDGIRLKVNGETVHDNWMDRSPTTDSNVLLNLNQEENLLTYEYYENSGGNVVEFQNFQPVTENRLTGAVEQAICGTETAATIFGDEITLSNGITTIGTGFQWFYSTSKNGKKIAISRANQKDLTPDVTAPPFNEPGEYYIFREVNVQSTNNRINQNYSYTTTHQSSPAHLVIKETPQMEITASPTDLCGAGEVILSGSFTGSGSYLVTVEINGTAVQDISVNTNEFSEVFPINETTTFNITRIVDRSTGCINDDPNASVTITVQQEISRNRILGAQDICGNVESDILEGSTPSGGNGTYSYQWLSSTTGPDEGFVPAAGVSNSINYSPGVLEQTTWFKRNVSSGVCNSLDSNVLKITVNPALSNNTIAFETSTGATLNLCKGTSSENISGSIPSGGTGMYEYVWESSTTGENNGFNPISGAINQNFSPGNVSQTTWLRRVVSSGNCEAEISNVLKVTVNPLPTAVVNAPESICQGQYATVEGEFTGTGPWRIDLRMNGSSFQNLLINEREFSERIPIYETTTFEVEKITDLGTSCANTNPQIFFTIQVKTQWEWTGTADTNWNNPANWSCNALPTLQTNVLIPSGLENYPILNTGNIGLCKNLTLEDGTTVQVINNELRIAGIFSNSGRFNSENGATAFVGNSAQIIPTGAFEKNRIKNLTINNRSGVTSKAILEITGILKAENGIFETNNNLTLISNKIQTALIDGSGNGEIQGTVKMQRYLDNSFGYKYFSVPFQNSTVGDFSSYVDLSAEFPNFYSYNEDREDAAGNDATGWETYTTTTAALNALEGYALNFGSESTAKTVEIAGTVNNNAFSRTLYNHNGEYTQGFNLVGNPYPSPIDWNAAEGWTRSNIDDAIYFFTAGSENRYTGTYTSFVNGIQSDDGKSSGIIPSMQGFFVHVSDVTPDDSPTIASFGMTNEVRVNNFSQPFLKQSYKNSTELIRLTASYEGEKMNDPAVIYFNSFATLNFEKDMDAHKLMNTAVNVPNLYSITPVNEKLAISAIPNPEFHNSVRIPLGLETKKEGNVIIQLKDFENSPTSYIYLVDLNKRLAQDLTKEPEYRFRSQKGQNDSRFYLMFSPTRLTDPAVVFDEPFSVKTTNGKVTVKMNLKPTEKGSLRISTVNGMILDVLKVQGQESVEIERIRSEGVYFISYLSEEAPFTKKVLVKK
ncbi:hypothetical protein [Salinimicrobium sp. GXAS 041]|uniref:hypothetical protein n=1 Tax=Salinimicrobium sp. GXAS 041 TaxID=3400806 RepID=UPI003C76B68F